MKKGFLNLLLIFILGLAVGLAIGWFWLRPVQPTASRLSGEPANSGLSGIVHNLRGQVVAVTGQNIKFSMQELKDRQVKAVEKTAQISSATVLYLLTPKIIADSGTETYQKKLAELKSQLNKAALAKDTKKIIAFKEEIIALTKATGADRDRQAEALNAKINALPADSAEWQAAEQTLLELTSAFKYSKITLAEIKSGDAIEVWSQDDISNKNSFTATRIEIRR